MAPILAGEGGRLIGTGEYRTYAGAPRLLASGGLVVVTTTTPDAPGSFSWPHRAAVTVRTLAHR